MRPFTFTLFTFLILLSCSKNKDYAISFANGKTLVSDTIPLKEIIHPAFMSIKNKNLIITSNKSDTMLFFYSLPIVEFIRKKGIKGNGPDDMLFPMFCETTSDDLYLWGYANLLKIKRFSIDTLANSQFKNDYFLDKYESFNQMHVVNDSLLIYSTIPSEFSIKKYDLINGVFLDEIKIETEDHNETFFYSNRGYMAANSAGIIYAYAFKKQIDIFNVDDLQKRNTLTGKYSYRQPIIGKFEANTYYNLGVFAGKKYFYALCQDENTSKNGKSIEVFDYSGRPVIKYFFDRDPDAFIVDEENGIIYGYSYDFEGYILKYDL